MRPQHPLLSQVLTPIGGIVTNEIVSQMTIDLTSAVSSLRSQRYCEDIQQGAVGVDQGKPPQEDSVKQSTER